jgi:hypothetical protein
MFYGSCNSFCCKLLVAACKLLLACFKFYCSCNTGSSRPALRLNNEWSAKLEQSSECVQLSSECQTLHDAQMVFTALGLRCSSDHIITALHSKLLLIMTIDYSTRICTESRTQQVLFRIITMLHRQADQCMRASVLPAEL